MLNIEIEKYLGKFLENIGKISLWLLIALSFSSLILLFLPQKYIPFQKGYLFFIVVLLLPTLFFKSISDLRNWKKSKKTFHITNKNHSYWRFSKQSDGKSCTSLDTIIYVKNCTQKPIKIVSAQVPGLVGKKEILYQSIETWPSLPDNVISQDITHELHIALLLKKKVSLRQFLNFDFSAKLKFFDSDGNSQKTKIKFYCNLPKKRKIVPEDLSKIKDITEMQIIIVLQAECDNYDVCGRSKGGLGSIKIHYNGNILNGVGSNYFISGTNKDIITDPENVIIKSSNIEALQALYNRADENTKTAVCKILVRKLNDKKYYKIHYFIVFFFWKIEKLAFVLQKLMAISEMKGSNDFRLSNVLMMLDGLLRYCYPFFDISSLDEIQSFVHGLNEYSFGIQEKIRKIQVTKITVNEYS